MSDEEDGPDALKWKRAGLAVVVVVGLFAVWKMDLQPRMGDFSSSGKSQDETEADQDIVDFTKAEQSPPASPPISAVPGGPVAMVPMAPAAQPAKECGVEVMRTRTTRWDGGSGAVNSGRSLKLDNDSGRPVFIKMMDWSTSRLFSTILLMPGETITEPVQGSQMRMDISYGSRWCGAEDGWLDEAVQVIKTPAIEHAGVMKMALTPGDGGTIKITAWAPANVQSRPEASEVSRSAIANVPRQRPATPSKAMQPQGEKPLNFVPPQGVLSGDTQGAPPRPVQQTPTAAEAQALPGLRRQPTKARLIEASTHDIAVPIQDWRHVPKRDVRLLSRNGRHKMPGTVAGESIEFDLSPGGNSYIGMSLAEQLSDGRCYRGWWHVVSSRFVMCKTVVPKVAIAGAELSNVLIAVVPENTGMVLGKDILGTGKAVAGRDGYYIRLGQSGAD